MRHLSLIGVAILMFVFTCSISEVLAFSGSYVVNETWPVGEIDISDKGIVWSEYFPGKGYNIWYKPHSGNPRLLYASPIEDRLPKIFGDWVVFQSTNNDVGDIILCNLINNKCFNITNSRDSENKPGIWGDKIVYLKNYKEVIVYNITSNKVISNVSLENIGINSGVISEADIFGDYVVFKTTNGSKSEIYLWKYNEGNPSLITSSYSRKYFLNIWGLDVYWYDDNDKKIYHYSIPYNRIKTLSWTGTVKYLDVYGENLLIMSYSVLYDKYIEQYYVYNVYANKYLQLTNDLSLKGYGSIYANLVSYVYDNYNIVILNLNDLGIKFGDSDGDGLSDIHEQNLGSNPLSVDSDNDGYSDYIEYVFGTSLIDPAEYPQSTFSNFNDTYSEDSNSKNSDSILDKLNNTDLNLNLSILYIKRENITGSERIKMYVNSYYNGDLVAVNVSSLNSSDWLKVILKLELAEDIDDKNISLKVKFIGGGEEPIELSTANNNLLYFANYDLRNVQTNGELMYFTASCGDNASDVVVLYLFTENDEDGDGLDVIMELNNGTFPFSNDTDNDGIPDNLDRHPTKPDERINISSKTPVALFQAPEMVLLGDEVVFASLSYDPDGNITSYQWDFGDGNTATGMIVQHKYDSIGAHIVRLTVEDAQGLKNYTQKKIIVTPVERKLKEGKVEVGGIAEVSIINHGGQNLIVNESVPQEFEILDCQNCTIHNNSIKLFIKKFSNSTYRVKALKPGVYNFSGIVSISGQDLETAQIDGILPVLGESSIKVLSPPQAMFTVYPNTSVESDQSVIFNASLSYDPDGNITSYQWDFGDGNTATGMIVQHKYSYPGNYNVTLRVLDNDGLVNLAFEKINVIEYNEKMQIKKQIVQLIIEYLKDPSPEKKQKIINLILLYIFR